MVPSITAAEAADAAEAQFRVFNACPLCLHSRQRLFDTDPDDVPDKCSGLQTAPGSPDYACRCARSVGVATGNGVLARPPECGCAGSYPSRPCADVDRLSWRLIRRRHLASRSVLCLAGAPDDWPAYDRHAFTDDGDEYGAFPRRGAARFGIDQHDPRAGRAGGDLAYRVHRAL